MAYLILWAKVLLTEYPIPTILLLVLVWAYCHESSQERNQ